MLESGCVGEQTPSSSPRSLLEDPQQLSNHDRGAINALLGALMSEVGCVYSAKLQPSVHL